MRTEGEIRTVLESAERVVNNAIGIGAPEMPSTPLEQHSFHMGRLSVLKWMLPEEEKAADSPAAV